MQSQSSGRWVTSRIWESLAFALAIHDGNNDGEGQAKKRGEMRRSMEMILRMGGTHVGKIVGCLDSHPEYAHGARDGVGGGEAEQQLHWSA